MIEYFCPPAQESFALRSGPLAPHLDSFAGLLAGQGYCPRKGWPKLRLVAELSQWLAQRRIRLEQLDEQKAIVFLQTRSRTRGQGRSDSGTLKLLLQHLRHHCLIPIARPARIRNSVDRLVEDYRQFLLQQRALDPKSVSRYVPVIGRFLRHRFPDGRVRLRQLGAGDAANFMLQAMAHYERRSLQVAAGALRSFLGLLLQRRRITRPLANAVPTVAARGLAELPKILEVVQVKKLLKSCDRRRNQGRRDYAILLLLARLGLRANEVAQLCLEDINWRVGELLVRGKGMRVDRLPLPHDVGQAIADYLKRRRSGGSPRRVFLRTQLPYEGFAGPSGVGSVVRRALARAQLHPPRQGAHLLRHTLAAHLLQGGASLAQIGQVLRHRQAHSTEIYAKVHYNALRALAQPWPGGAR